MAAPTLKNPISQLQELCQLWKLPTPIYRECEGSYQAFGTEVTVLLDQAACDETIVYKALGRTKKASKTNVAQLVLDYVAQNKPHLLERPEVPEVSGLGGQRSLCVCGCCLVLVLVSHTGPHTGPVQCRRLCNVGGCAM